MPTVFRRGDYRFFFSNEGDPRETPHVHVRRDGDETKFWDYRDSLLNPQMKVDHRITLVVPPAG
jgi:hypothetical protein